MKKYAYFNPLYRRRRRFFENNNTATTQNSPPLEGSGEAFFKIFKF
ncbi:MAG: hypothetical protein RL757_45 [Bacteroidota bacterium]|jgi:hypothetical protein